MEAKSVEDATERLRTLVRGHLLARGFNAESPATLRGKSGAEHTASLSAASDGAARLLLDTYLSPEKIDEAEVISTFMKVLDTAPSQAFIVCVPGATVMAHRLARFYGIDLVEGSDVEEALASLGKRLPNAASFRGAAASHRKEFDPNDPGVLNCYRCGYTWKTRSISRYVTCPSCHFKLNQERVRSMGRPPEQISP